MNAPDSKAATTDQGAALGVIETDTFCEKCGFNLHTQRVWRDERLGILVCRCPECGGHSAAGRNIAVTVPWMNRLATALMLIYLALGVAFVIGVFFAGMGMFAAADEGLTYRNVIDETGMSVGVNSVQKPDGTYEVYWLRVDGTGGNLKPEQVREVITLVPWLTGGSLRYAPNYYHYVPFWPAVIVAGVMAIGWMVIGMIFAAGSWFWRAKRQYLWLLVPIFSYGVVLTLVMWESNTYSRWGNVAAADPRPLQWRLFTAVLVLQIVLLAFSIRFGRPALRFLLLIFMPPKARQLFAFLWHCDGKTLPPAKTKYES